MLTYRVCLVQKSVYVRTMLKIKLTSHALYTYPLFGLISFVHMVFEFS